MAIENRNYMRYFIYSTEQMKLKRQMQKKLGRELVLGTVIVKGEQKAFTEMVESLSSVRYSDAEIVIYADIRDIKYTNPG